MQLCRIRYASGMCRKQALKVLGLGMKASAEDAKRAFRDKAFQWHPDLNPASDAQARFLTAINALHVLQGKQEKRFSPILGPCAEHGDSQVAREAEELGLRRAVVLSADTDNNKVRKHSVVLILSLGSCGDRGIILNGGRSGYGGPDNVMLQTVLHGAFELAEQGPVIDSEELFAEALLNPCAAEKLVKLLKISKEPYVRVSGNLEWGAWGLQKEVAAGKWFVHAWEAEDFHFWLREGRHLPRAEFWSYVRAKSNRCKIVPASWPAEFGDEFLCSGCPATSRRAQWNSS